jgi:hypothetical protein
VIVSAFVMFPMKQLLPRGNTILYTIIKYLCCPSIASATTTMAVSVEISFYWIYLINNSNNCILQLVI